MSYPNHLQGPSKRWLGETCLMFMTRIIQMFIANANGPELEIIIKELSPHVAEVLLDPHANYMFQSLMQTASPQQRYALLLNVRVY